MTAADAINQARRDFEATLAERVKGCPFCGVVFLKVHKRKYCSPRCTQKANWKAFIARKQAKLKPKPNGKGA